MYKDCSDVHSILNGGGLNMEREKQLPGSDEEGIEIVKNQLMESYQSGVIEDTWHANEEKNNSQMEENQ